MSKEPTRQEADAELRAFCLFGRDSTRGGHLFGTNLPGEIHNELDEVVESVVDLPRCEADRLIREATWRVRDRYDGADRVGIDGPIPRGNIETVLAIQWARAKKLGVRCTLTRDEWSSIVTAFDATCAYCNGSPGHTLDHIIPLSRGGPHAADNVVPACAPCNWSKNAADLIDWLERRGFSLGAVLARIGECQSKALGR